MSPHVATLTSHCFAARLLFWREQLIRQNTTKRRRSRPHEEQDNNECRTRSRHYANGNKLDAFLALWNLAVRFVFFTIPNVSKKSALPLSSRIASRSSSSKKHG
jgi:hypothetical protein